MDANDETVGMQTPETTGLTDTERVVASTWADVLKSEDIDADTDFFAAGGNSMTATLAIYRLRDWFGLDLPLMLIFESSTVAELARAIDELSEEGSDDGPGDPGASP
ncbi:MAG TPA: phosphopantetheine-binding protein [Streptosporangiaceae bacterium]